MGSVVVNEFEVLRDAQPRQSQPGAPAANDAAGAKPDALPPQDVKYALQTLRMQALRVWAH